MIDQIKKSLIGSINGRYDHTKSNINIPNL